MIHWRHRKRMQARPDPGAPESQHGHPTVVETVNRIRAHVLEENGRSDIIRTGLDSGALGDLYHTLMTMSWFMFFWASIGLYLVINIGFALMYYIIPHSVSGIPDGDFLDDIFFSVQTISTVGYGTMSPVGRLTNTIVSFEVLAGMMLNALATGLVFARFSRPRARVLFSHVAVVSYDDVIPTLTIRIANQRRTLILSANIEMTLTRLMPDERGRLVRRFDRLTLVQSHMPIFRISLNATHLIDGQSPLYGLSAETLIDQNAEIIITMDGTDEISSQTVFARHAYEIGHVKHGYRFSDMIANRPDGRVEVDFRRFHTTEPGDTPQTPDPTP
ncbi:ATP-sensitive potassium channel protein [Gluconobacter sp. LMG 1744]|uniref:ATP-sensitive potassium channel protein n=1 Tax=Gluconobacter cadivus TaxID=2728101 RepID=A0ABR9YTV4_9PROT|nr:MULTISPECIES: ion channel [Gluconobacter]MBF0887673.1 ATP-sensitive potassium channel protein [Gluconobacter cadivus]MBF0890138.1 ATP-sensitive potassium channel protein [Gluconobacter cadivus]MBS1058743.1 ATP-sensitive potassium channel protein [Gluconobacter sp. Dm-44]MBS1073511.1 ATP-sensitive potassium channel protein [Gluconobacter sp. Dm-73]